MDRGANHNYDKIWRAPLTRGRWYTFLVHKYMSSSDSTGYVELWVDGARQSFVNGATRFHTNTLASDHSGAYQFFLNDYRAANTANMSDIFFDGAGVRATRAQPHHRSVRPKRKSRCRDVTGRHHASKRCADRPSSSNTPARS
jgi:hypothetical protein